jgi:CheY-like chemotaxis protein
MANHGTIFYVDDNPKSRRLLTSVIRSCGFDVLSAGDPIEALSRIRKSSFDLALLDYQMPHLTGSQLAHKIKNMKPDIPVVLLSGFSALPPFELIFVDAHIGRGARTKVPHTAASNRSLTRLVPASCFGYVAAR